MLNCILNRFENDIQTIYENNYGKVDLFNIESLSRATQVCNAVLADICQSYYFEKKYGSFRLMDIKDANGNQYSYVSSPFKNDNTGIGHDTENKHIYYIRNGVFFKDVNSRCNMLDCQFNRGIAEDITESYLNIKNTLIQDPFYEKLFETNPIKKALILKGKEDFKITVLDKGVELKDFANIIKEQKITNDKELDSYLNFSCGINFVNLEKQSTYSFFIVHNDEDIVGVGGLTVNPFLKDLPDSDNFKYLSFIAVNSAYRGHSVGLKISDEIMSYCSKNNYVYERSGASRDGAMYMEAKIDMSSSKFENTLPIIKEHYGEIVRDYIKNRFKEGSDYDTERSLLSQKIIQLKAIEQEKGKLLKGDLRKIFGSVNNSKLKY